MTASTEIPDAAVRVAAQAIAETFNEQAGALATGETAGSLADDWLSEARAALVAALPALREQWGADLERFANEAGIDGLRAAHPLVGRDADQAWVYVLVQAAFHDDYCEPTEDAECAGACVEFALDSSGLDVAPSAAAEQTLAVDVPPEQAQS